MFRQNTCFCVVLVVSNIIFRVLFVSFSYSGTYYKLLSLFSLSFLSSRLFFVTSSNYFAVTATPRHCSDSCLYFSIYLLNLYIAKKYRTKHKPEFLEALLDDRRDAWHFCSPLVQEPLKGAVTHGFCADQVAKNRLAS